MFKDKDYCIIFLKNETGESSVGHWVVVFFNRQEYDKKIVNFFCSYGTDIKKSAPDLVHILFQYFDTIRCNKTQFQQFNTAPCGRYCILVYVLSQIIKKFKMKDIKMFLDNLKGGKKTSYDNIVCDLINKDL